MLPVAHQACTLATGALRSSCTMTVRPFGRLRIRAVLAGNRIAAFGSSGSVLRRAVFMATAAGARLGELRRRQRSRPLRGRRLCFRGKRSDKNLLEIEDTLEVVEGVLLGFAENPSVDEV